MNMNFKLLFIILLAYCPSLCASAGASAAAAAGAGAGRAPVDPAQKLGKESADVAACAAPVVPIKKDAHIFSTGGTNGTNQPTFSPNGNFLAISNDETKNVSVFSVDQRTGVLTAVAGSPFAMQRKFKTTTFSPNWQLLAVPNLSSGSVSVFSVDQRTGNLTAVAGSPFTAGSGPIQEAFSPNGQLLAVSNHFSNNVSLFSVNQHTGFLTPITGSPFATGINPHQATFSPNGQLLAVSNYTSDTVSIFSVDQRTGFLTPVVGSPFATGRHPSRAIFSPNGQLLAVSNSASDTVSLFSVNQHTGFLTPITGSPFVTEKKSPHQATFSPNGQLLAVSNSASDTVSIFSVDQRTGFLTPVVGSPFATGRHPNRAIFSPNGQLLAVSNYASYTVSVFSIDQHTGALTAMTGSLPVTQDNPSQAIFSPNGQLLAISSDNQILMYEVDESIGTVSPITGDALKTVKRQQEHARMHDALLKPRVEQSQTKPPILAGGTVAHALEEYIVGPKPGAIKPVSQATQEEEAQALDPATALTHKQRAEKDADAMKLFAAIKAGSFDTTKQHLTPFTVNARDEDYRTPLTSAAFYNQTNIALHILGYTGTQEEYGKKITVKPNLQAEDRLKNTALSYATAHKNDALAQALVAAIEKEKKIPAGAKKD